MNNSRIDINKYSFSLAPLRGITGKEFRTALTRNFNGISACFLPFVSVTEVSADKFSRYSNIFTLDELLNKVDYEVIPQIIGNYPPAIARISAMFRDNGFNHVNLNLGCPMPQITKKMRGSGLLPYPDKIKSILDEVFKVNNLKFSVKIRLGLNSYEDAYDVIAVLNNYPLHELIIHPRLAIDRYAGEINLTEFEKVMKMTSIPVTYNGDIVDYDTFIDKTLRFPNITNYMIGRGLVACPFLVEAFKANHSLDYNFYFDKFRNFYYDLIDSLEECEERDNVSRLKAYWIYFKKFFPDSEEVYHKMVRCNSISEMKI